MRLRVLELFAGIGACSKALERLGIEHEIVDAVEIDKYAIASFNAIHGTNFEPQDITKWDKDVEVDLIMHGSPCQDFSLAGLGAGGDEGSGTRSSLMYETIRIVEKLKPKYIIWENVKNVISKKHIHNFNNYLERMSELGYTSYYQVLNAKDYGIPQNRERVFTISIRVDINNHPFLFPLKQKLKLKLKDMLEDEVDEKYYLSEKMINYISATGTANFKNSDSKINLDVARPLTTDQNKRAGTTNYLSEDLPDNYDLNVKINVVGKTKSGGERSLILGTDGLCNTLTATDYKQPKQILEEKFVSNKYKEFIDKNGYIPEMFNPYNEAEIKTIAPTQTTQCGSTTSSAAILIKNATKQGYLEASEGDGINISARMHYQRGNVQKESCQTIDTQCNVGVVVVGNYSPSNHNASRVVDPNYIAPCVMENHGTVTGVVVDE